MFPYRFRHNITNLDMKPRFPDNKYAFITCFYPIKEGPMKQSIDEYKTKISRLFNIFNKKMLLFIFTNDEGKEILRSSRFSEGQSISLTNNIKFITKYQKIFDIPNISEFKSQYENIAAELQKDSTTNITAEFGAINTAKYIFLQDAINIYANESKLFFWIDIDTIKTDDITKQMNPLSWPSPERMDKIFFFNLEEEVNEEGYVEKVLFMGNARNFKKAGSVDDVNLNNYDGLVDSGFFGGTPDKLNFFIKEYFSIHMSLLKKKQNILRDELVLGAFMALNKNDIFLFDMNKQKCNRQEAPIAFLSNSNLCDYNNKLYVFMTRRGSYAPVAKQLEDWLQTNQDN